MTSYISGKSLPKYLLKIKSVKKTFRIIGENLLGKTNNVQNIFCSDKIFLKRS